jgi:hypothetical protein
MIRPRARDPVRRLGAFHSIPQRPPRHALGASRMSSDDEHGATRAVGRAPPDREPRGVCMLRVRARSRGERRPACDLRPNDASSDYVQRACAQLTALMLEPMLRRGNLVFFGEGTSGDRDCETDQSRARRNNTHDYEVALVSSTKFPIEGPFRPRLIPLGPGE